MRLVLLALVALAAVLRLTGIATQSFWFDEFATVSVLDHGFPELFGAIRDDESTPPAYYLLAFGWRELFGSGELALRSLSALLGTATVPIVYGAARSLAGPRAGLLAATLTATSPLLVWYSQEARAYALLVFAAGLSFLFFVEALTDRRERWRWGWAAASILALATHYFAILLVLPEAMLLLYRRRGAWIRGSLPVAAVVGAGALLVPLAAEQRGRAFWIGLFDLGDRLVQVPQHLAVGLNSPSSILPPLAIAALVVVIAYALVRADGEIRRAAALAGGVALAGAALAVTPALFGEDSLITRNLIVLWPPIAVAAGTALAAPRAAPLGLGAALATGLLGVALIAWNASTPAAQRPDWRRVAELTGQPREGWALAGPHADVLPLLLYLPDSSVAPIGEPLRVRALDLVSYAPVEDYGIGPCWWGVVCGGERFFVPDAGIEPPAGLELTSGFSTERFRVRRYRAKRPVELPRPRYESSYIVPGD